jgi:hypothetical protein
MARSPLNMRFRLHIRRLRVCAVLLLGLLLVPACRGIDQSGFSGDVNVLLARGTGFYTSLTQRRARS